ncbi:protein TonB [Tistlia consotensis]|uniref:Protein TonB n=1 Tax=Tistlia consotensis USBA 355 TaxID=560819 RepID=A0A1Y6B7S9_9PROT|nr:TonB family protein [Tistlia consotensis]SME97404.1 protein TonB [Tistlia consotensis USBA 355]SNR56741.1 protein TonB [Tistlia consotensis]
MAPCLSLGALRPGLPVRQALAGALLLHLLAVLLLLAFLPGRSVAPASSPALEVAVVGLGEPLAVPTVTTSPPEAAGSGEAEPEPLRTVPTAPALRPVERAAEPGPVGPPAAVEPAVDTAAAAASAAAVPPPVEEAVPPPPPVRPAVPPRAVPEAPSAAAVPPSSAPTAGQARRRPAAATWAAGVPAAGVPAAGVPAAGVAAAGAPSGGPAGPAAAVASRGAGGSGPAAAAGALQDYISRLAAWLERHRRYPKRARLLRQEGVAVVRFRIDRRGRLLDSRLQSSSGHELLDAEALDLLKRSAPLPAPAGPADAGQEFVLPIRFELR